MSLKKKKTVQNRSFAKCFKFSTEKNRKILSIKHCRFLYGIKSFFQRFGSLKSNEGWQFSYETLLQIMTQSIYFDAINALLVDKAYKLTEISSFISKFRTFQPVSGGTSLAPSSSSWACAKVDTEWARQRDMSCNVQRTTIPRAVDTPCLKVCNHCVPRILCVALCEASVLFLSITSLHTNGTENIGSVAIETSVFNLVKNCINICRITSTFNTLDKRLVV